MPPGRLPSRPVRSAVRARRERISDAATTLFIERGFDRVSIADVAEAAAVSKMTVTNHFPLKEDLVFDIFADELDDVRSAVRGCRSLAESLAAVEQYCVGRESSGPMSAALRGGWRRDGLRLFAIMVVDNRALTARFHLHYVDVRDVLMEVLPVRVRGIRRTTAAWMIAETVHLIDWWPLEQAIAGQDPAAIERGRRRLRRHAFAELRRALTH